MNFTLPRILNGVLAAAICTLVLSDRAAGKDLNSEAANCVQRLVGLYNRADQQVTDYTAKLLSLKQMAPGTVVDFGGGETMIMKRFLGHGGSMALFENSLGQCIRAPFGASMNLVNFDSIEKFVEMMGELRGHGVPVVGVDEKASRLPKYLVVECLDIQFTLGDFHRGHAGFSKIQQRKAEDALVEFARTTWRYTYIGDFDSSQLGYVGGRWILFDVGRSNMEIQNVRQTAHLFDPQHTADGIEELVSPELHDRITQVIVKERALHLDDATAPGVATKSVWFQRQSNANYLVRTEGGLDLLMSSPFSMPDGDNRVVVKKLVKNGNKSGSAVFAVEVGKEHTKGYLEILLDVRKREDEYTKKSAGRLLKKWGYEKFLDWGPDYALVLK